MKCAYHPCKNNLEGKRAKAVFCCLNCKNNHHVDKRRKKLKQMAVEHKGGKCCKCGYNKCIWALDFHHIDKESKNFKISSSHTRSWEKIKEELEKCELVCSNCHREEEYNRKQKEYNTL